MSLSFPLPSSTHARATRAHHPPTHVPPPHAPPPRARAGLRGIASAHVKEVRGEGLLCGVQLDVPAGPVVTAAREMGVLAITAGAGDVIRLVPPLVVTDEEIDACVAVLGKAIAQLPAAAKA